MTGSPYGIVTQNIRCRACDHSLMHQVRHEHPDLKLIVVTCPECGQIWPASERSLPKGMFSEGLPLGGQVFFAAMCGAFLAIILGVVFVYLFFAVLYA